MVDDWRKTSSFFFFLSVAAKKTFSPWSMPVRVVRFDLTKLKKNKNKLKLIQNSIKTFLELSSFPNHSKIFTDGSKCSETVAAAAAADGNFQTHLVCRLPYNFSIYTAELHAIHLDLKLVCHAKKQPFLVVSDSCLF